MPGAWLSGVAMWPYVCAHVYVFEVGLVGVRGDGNRGFVCGSWWQ